MCEHKCKFYSVRLYSSPEQKRNCDIYIQAEREKASNYMSTVDGKTGEGMKAKAIRIW